MDTRLPVMATELLKLHVYESLKLINNMKASDRKTLAWSLGVKNKFYNCVHLL